jgi:ABC-type sugar transport system ATPase subunit
MTTPLACRAVSVAYDADPVLRTIDLDVGPEEVVAVLGPSGSGKTTLLYAVAGFLDLAAGEIAIGGRTVATTGDQDPPEARDVGFVFQHYALWPHLDALETVAYPLRRRGLDRAEAARQAGDLLERMGIAGLSHRKPAELSGGQQQRVGLARALAGRPALYLFEPRRCMPLTIRARRWPSPIGLCFCVMGRSHRSGPLTRCMPGRSICGQPASPVPLRYYGSILPKRAAQKSLSAARAEP